MRRRELMVGLVGAAAWPLAARVMADQVCRHCQLELAELQRVQGAARSTSAAGPVNRIGVLSTACRIFGNWRAKILGLSFALLWVAPRMIFT
jgi:hypothetical protein